MRKTIVAFFTMIVLLSSACVIAVVDSGSGAEYWPKSTFRKNLDMPAGSAVTLENGSGDIEIIGWKEERIAISAEKSWGFPNSVRFYFYSGKFSRPDIQVTSRGNSVRVRTKEDGYGESDGTVNYVLQVPHSVNLDSIRNGRGRIAISDIYGRTLLDAEEGEIKIRNYSGSLDVRLGSGSVEAEILDLRPQDSVRIKVEHGDILMLLEPNVNAQFLADTPAGSITGEFELGQPLPAKKVSFKLGEGLGSIELTALEGDIRLRKVEEKS